MDLAHRLAETLRRLREDAGLTQVELARRLRMKQSTLNRLENATNNATLRTLDRLCRALECEPGDLFQPGSLRLRGGRRGR